MRWPSRARLVVSAGAALVLVVLAAAAFRTSRSLRDAPVSTLAVARARFVREVVADGELKAVRATPILVPIEGERGQTVAFMARDGAPVKAGEVLIRFDPREAEREAADGRDDLEAARGKIDKARADGGKTQKSLYLERDLAHQELDRARTFVLKDETLYSRHQIVESTLDRDLQEKKSGAAEKRLAASEKLGEAGVALGTIEQDKAALRLHQAERSLGALTVKAPHDGLFVLERGWSGEVAHVGNTLWPGQKVAEIPDLQELEARVFALEADAAGLKDGLPGRLTIEGRPGEVHVVKVASVQPVARPRGKSSPVKFFETRVALETTDTRIMRPGQKVQVTITLEEMSDVIAIPRGALFEKDGRRIVYCRRGERYVPVAVSVGPNSVARVVITKGLASGDLVALRDPAESAGRIFGPHDTAGARP
jgi:multidrug efflux pump subunit AcrA (membrane-fusion protein)